MTHDEVRDIHARIDRIETSVLAEIKEINEKLTLMAVASARRECNEPGACVILRAEMLNVRKQQEIQAASIGKLDRWQSWIMGIGTTAIFFIGLFGPSIRYKLGLP